ncbi:MAG: hypothetical protein ACPGNT_09275, partial [Rhodospirillales bacterium]
EMDGDLFKNRQVTFLRRNEMILEMRYVKDEKRILIEGKYLTRDNQKRLLDLGLNTEGQVRIITDSAVTEHNATKVVDWTKKPNYKMYIWDIVNVTSRAPRMKIAVR